MLAKNLLTVGYKGIIDKLSNSIAFDPTAIHDPEYGWFDTGGGGIRRGPVLKYGRTMTINYIAIYDQINDLKHPCFTCRLPYSCGRLSGMVNHWVIPSRQRFAICYFCYSHYIEFIDHYEFPFKLFNEIHAIYYFSFSKESYMEKDIRYERILRELEDEETIIEILTTNTCSEEIINSIIESSDPPSRKFNNGGLIPIIEGKQTISREGKTGLIPVEYLPPILRLKDRTHMYALDPSQLLDPDFNPHNDDWHSSEKGPQDMTTYQYSFQFLCSHQLTDRQLELVILNHYNPGVILLCLLLYNDLDIIDKIRPEIKSGFKDYFKIESYHITEFHAFKSPRNTYLLFKILQHVPAKNLYYDEFDYFIKGIDELPLSQRQEIRRWAFFDLHEIYQMQYLSINDLPDIIDIIIENHRKYGSRNSQYYQEQFLCLLLILVNQDISNFSDCFYALYNLQEKIQDNYISCYGGPDEENTNEAWRKVCQKFSEFDSKYQLEFMKKFLENIITNKYSNCLSTSFHTLNYYSKGIHLHTLQKYVQEKGWEDQVMKKSMRILIHPYFSREDFIKTSWTEDFEWIDRDSIDEIYGFSTYYLDWEHPKQYPKLNDLALLIEKYATNNSTIERYVIDPSSGDFVHPSNKYMVVEKIYSAMFTIYDELIAFYISGLDFSEFPLELFDHDTLLDVRFFNCKISNLQQLEKIPPNLTSIVFENTEIGTISPEFFNFPNLKLLKINNCPEINPPNNLRYLPADCEIAVSE